MSRLKYIHFENLGIIIFPEAIEHYKMASWLKDEPISAGFVFIPEKDDCGNIAHCYGESVSLNLKSKDIDTKLLKRMLSFHY